MAKPQTKIIKNNFIEVSIILATIVVFMIGIFAITNFQYNSKASNSTPTTATPSAPVPVPEAPKPPTQTTNTPTLNPIKNNDIQIVGNAAPNSSILIKDGTGNAVNCKNLPITSDVNGNYNCQLVNPLPTNTQLNVTAVETGKLVSAPVSATVSEATAVVAPATPTNSPTLTPIKSNDIQISGTAVPNSVITIKDGTGNPITCKNSPLTADASGNYACQLNNTIVANTQITVTATENGKAASAPTSTVVINATGTTPMPVFTPMSIVEGTVLFNVPEALRNSSQPNQFTANFNYPNLGDWKLSQGAPIAALAGMVPVLAQKDPGNFLSTVLSNQTPEVANKPSVRIALDQAALDAASGVTNFKPVEIGGVNDLVRIPNLSTRNTDDWWYIPKANLEVGGYKVQPDDVTNVGKPEAFNAFYKGSATDLATPTSGEALPYSFILQGTPDSYSLPNNFAMNGKASTPENLTAMDGIVKASNIPSSKFKFALPKLNLPNVNPPSVAANKGWDWSWLWWLLLLPLLMFLWWLLRKLFGWFGGSDDSYSTTKTSTQINTSSIDYKLNQEVTVPKAPTIETPKFIAPEVDSKANFKTAAVAATTTAAAGYVFDKVSKKYKKAKVEETIETKHIADEVDMKVVHKEEPMHVKQEIKHEEVKKSPKYLAEALDEIEDKPLYASSSVKTETHKVTSVHSTKKDDFQVIEGIGPVIESNLHEAGIMTYEDLANTSDAEIERILAPITNNFTVFNCSTWAEQARLAADGKWDKLDVLKDELVRGVRIDGSSTSSTVTNSSHLKHTLVTDDNESRKHSTHTSTAKHSNHIDDLKIVEGIGPVIESNLHNAGIRTYEDLANCTEAQIELILAPIKNNFTVFNCSTWAEQARLAADGKFDELQKLKDILDKGVRK
jgi:predicted flap endonuclease-1-like 5' DNA nuclease